MPDSILKLRLDGIDPLTHEELDGNFIFLDEKVEAGQFDGTVLRWNNVDERWKESTAINISLGGQVGVNGAPSTTFHVQGTENYTGSSPSQTSYTTTVTSGTAHVGIGQSSGMPSLQGSGTGTSYNLILNPNAGNVGIGTVSPNAKLDVEGAITSTSATGAVNDPGSFAAFWSNGGDTNIAGSATHLLTGANNNRSRRLSITNVGDVGIGIDTPTNKLEVLAGQSGPVAKFTASNDGNVRGLLLQTHTSNGAGWNFHILSNDGSFKFSNSSRNLIDVASNGTTVINGSVNGRDMVADGAKLDGIEVNSTNFKHPTHPGDDINLDTGPLGGATVISDLDFNVTTDTLGHVTDANATYSTRNITPANIGAVPASGGTFTGNLTVNGTLSVRTAIDLADNDILRFGSGDDAEFFCDGNHMYTDLNPGIGNWYIRDGSTVRYTFNDNGNFTATGTINGRNVAADGTKLDGIETGANAYSHPSHSVSNINTSGATIIDYISTTSLGHVSAMGTRVLTLANLGYTGDTNANNYVFPYTVSTASTPSTVVQRDGSGDISARLFRSEYDTTNTNIGFIMTQVDTAGNNYIRPTTAAQFRTGVITGHFLPINGKATDADKLDGIHGSSFVRSDATDVISGAITHTNHVYMQDNKYLYFGTGNDVEFFCNGSNMYMDLNTGINDFYIRDGGTIRYTFNDNGTLTATDFVSTSDRRAKDKITTVAGDVISKLNGREWNWKETGKKGSGVIAQELEEAGLDHLVLEDGEGMKSVAYNGLIAYLIEEVKSLRIEIEGLK